MNISSVTGIRMEKHTSLILRLAFFSAGGTPQPGKYKTDKGIFTAR